MQYAKGTIVQIVSETILNSTKQKISSHDRMAKKQTLMDKQLYSQRQNSK